ncbi:MAG: hypothetical protein KGJ06_05625 [Pseudomonadota bacterium]|nr:hypothetical protein [Pseudomonadota bacterium]
MRPKHEDENAGSAVRSGGSGVEGFPSALAGRAKAAHGHTSSFDIDPQGEQPATGISRQVTGGQEEDARMRQPSTSAAGRVPPERP